MNDLCQLEPTTEVTINFYDGQGPSILRDSTLSCFCTSHCITHREMNIKMGIKQIIITQCSDRIRFAIAKQ